MAGLTGALARKQVEDAVLRTVLDSVNPEKADLYRIKEGV